MFASMPTEGIGNVTVGYLVNQAGSFEYKPAGLSTSFLPAMSSRSSARVNGTCTGLGGALRT